MKEVDPRMKSSMLLLLLTFHWRWKYPKKHWKIGKIEERTVSKNNQILEGNLEEY